MCIRDRAKLLIRYAPFTDAALAGFELKRALESLLPGIAMNSGGAKLLIRYAPFTDAALAGFELKRALESLFPGIAINCEGQEAPGHSDQRLAPQSFRTARLPHALAMN